MHELPDELLKVHGILEQYVQIHDKIFKASWRKVIPIPGVFKSINFEKHATDLSRLILDLEKISSQGQQKLPSIFHEYVTALFNAILSLKDICKKLNYHGQKVESYPYHRYKKDVEAYNLLVANYRNLGHRLNEYMRETLTDRNPVNQVRRIIEEFIKASFLWIGNQSNKYSSKGLEILLYMFGAVDMISQIKGINEKDTLDLFQNMLQEELGEYSAEEANVILRTVVEATKKPENQQVMKHGGEALRLWLLGDVTAPRKLYEILNSD